MRTWARTVILTLTWTLGLALPGTSHARDAATAIQHAVAVEEELEYEQARRLWLEIITRDDLSEEQRVEANLHAGSIARILGRDVEARSHFVYVISRRPDYLLPEDTTPRVLHFFELIRQEMAPPPAAAQVAPARDTSTGGDGAPLLWAGAGVAGLGALVAVTGGVIGVLANVEHEQAAAAEIQLVQEEHYRTRDSLALAANISFVGAVVLVAGGATLAALGWLGGGE